MFLTRPVFPVLLRDDTDGTVGTRPLQRPPRSEKNAGSSVEESATGRSGDNKSPL
jgi:hypothetical protein